MQRILALLAVLLMATGCASPLLLDDEGALAIVPYRISESGQIVIDVMVEGKGPYVFALDTGASITVIFDDAREKAGVSPQSDKEALIHGMVGTGRFPLITIGQLQVGGASWGNARVASMPGNDTDGRGLDGILGIDFLSQFAVAISADENVVRFHNRDLVAERYYQGWSSIPLQRMRVGSGDATAYTIELVIGGHQVPALFDLGSSVNVMNWRAARAVGARPVRSRRHSRVSGVIDDAPVSAQLRVRVLRITDLYWRNRTFLIADFPIFEILKLNDRPISIVGAGLFSDHSIVVDFSRERLLVRKLKR